MIEKTASVVSFGSVATVEYDVSSNSIVVPVDRMAQNLSVEDFEKLRYSNRHFRRHGARRASARTTEDAAFDERTKRLQELRMRIEETMSATDAALRGEIPAMLSSPSIRAPGSNLFTASFPSPKSPQMIPPRTRSMTRVSQLRLSKLDLRSSNSRHQLGVTDRFRMEGGNMKNAVFDLPQSYTSPLPPVIQDLAPKCPTRKRSNECISAEDSLRHKRLGEEHNPTGAANATWGDVNVPRRPTKRRSHESLELLSSQCDKGRVPVFLGNRSPRHSEAIMQNATWRM